MVAPRSTLGTTASAWRLRTQLCVKQRLHGGFELGARGKSFDSQEELRSGSALDAQEGR